MAEQHIYDTLWREARIVADEYREITIGYRALAQKTRLHRNTIDRNLASLQAKLAIEVIRAEDRAENIGRTYRVYGFRSILNRREAVGWVWSMKDRSGVRLLRDRDLDTDSSEVTGPVTSGVTRPVTLRHAGSVTLKVTRPITTKVTNIKEHEDTLLATSTSAITGAVQEELGYIDAEAIARIVSDCRKRVADATIEEIAQFTRLTARRIRTLRGLSNPVGLLIVQVPKCFEGEPFQLHRRAAQARKEAENREILRVANDVLLDPEMPEESRRWAADLLATTGQQQSTTAAPDTRRMPKRPSSE